MAEVAGSAVALTEVEALENAGQLNEYQYLPAVKADLLLRLGCGSAAAEAYQRALGLTHNEPEREFLAERLASSAT